MKNRITLLLICLIALNACKSTSETVSVKAGAEAKSAKETVFSNGEQAVIWQQTSAEYVALCHQAFNAATKQINYYNTLIRNTYTTLHTRNHRDGGYFIYNAVHWVC